MSVQQFPREADSHSKPKHSSPSFSSSGSIIVLALGNPLRGDDGVGQMVIEALEEVETLPIKVTIQDGGGGVLLNLLLTEPPRRVIIVDAGNIGQRPGEWVQCTPKDISLTLKNGRSYLTLHNASLREVLTLGEALEIQLPEITIYAVQPKSLGYSLDLSEEVKQAVPEICGAIMADLYMEQMLEKDRKHNTTIEKNELVNCF